MLDILIKNGTVIDGTGSQPKVLDVAVQSGVITELAPKISAKARETIDAQDRFVTPGFIDIQNHSDSYLTLFDQPEQASLLAQGITSAVVGNCGASLAPLLTRESIKSIQKWHNLEGINLNWDSVPEFLQELAKLPLGINVATLVGHATLRRGLIGDEVRTLTNEELKVMDKSLVDGLDGGALGLSMGLIYAHEVNSSFEEMVVLCKNLAPRNKYLSVHLRSESSHILESLDEVIDLAQKSGAAVKIAHLKLRGQKNWPLFEIVLEKIEKAYHRGLKISFDVYPYDTSWPVLYTYLPKWVYEGGRTGILDSIASPSNRRKILDYLKDQNHDLGSILVATAPGNSNFVGKTIRQIARNQGIGNEEAVLNVIAATKAQVIVFDHNLSQDHVESLIKSPLSMIATDGTGYSKKVKGLAHPRCFGTMPRFLRMVREKKTMKWEQAVAKITGDPSKLMGLTQRGLVQKNFAADLVVFDPKTVSDRSDYVNPDVLPVGIEAVVVNGSLAFLPNQFLGATGQVLKR